MQKLTCSLLVVLFLGSVSMIGAPIVFVATSAREFGSMDLATGVFTNGVMTTNTVAGLGVAAVGNPYFVDTASSLYQVDPATGALTLIGPTGIASIVATSMSAGVLYAMDAANSVYSINPASGAATLIGSSGLGALGPGFSNGLAASGSTLYYILEMGGGSPIASSLFRIDATTGAATFVGLTGASSIQGAVFAGGQLYGFSSSGAIVTVDTNTGAATALSSYAGQTQGAVWGAVQNTPEPGTTAMFLLGGLALAALGRFRR